MGERGGEGKRGKIATEENRVDFWTGEILIMGRDCLLEEGSFVGASYGAARSEYYAQEYDSWPPSRHIVHETRINLDQVTEYRREMAYGSH